MLLPVSAAVRKKRRERDSWMKAGKSVYIYRGEGCSIYGETWKKRRHIEAVYTESTAAAPRRIVTREIVSLARSLCSLKALWMKRLWWQWGEYCKSCTSGVVMHSLESSLARARATMPGNNYCVQVASKFHATMRPICQKRTTTSGRKTMSTSFRGVYNVSVYIAGKSCRCSAFLNFLIEMNFSVCDLWLGMNDLKKFWLISLWHAVIFVSNIQSKSKITKNQGHHQ